MDLRKYYRGALLACTAQCAAKGRARRPGQINSHRGRPGLARIQQIGDPRPTGVDLRARRQARRPTVAGSGRTPPRHRAVSTEAIPGREIDTAGDAFFATFDRPANAIGCAIAIIESVRPVGLEVRAGVHAGEVEPSGRKVGGIAVHTAARVVANAQAGEVLPRGPDLADYYLRLYIRGIAAPLKVEFDRIITAGDHSGHAEADSAANPANSSHGVITRPPSRLSTRPRGELRRLGAAHPKPD
jgi:hypothetical protein